MSIYQEKEEWVIASVESILNQSYQKLEFIIILDDPNNNTVRDRLEYYQTKDSRIKVFANTQNKGLVYSLNKALSYAHGEYIARMDADDISYPQRLEKQLQYLKDNHLDLIGSNVELFNEKEVFYTTNKLVTHFYLKKLLSLGTIGIVHPTFFAKKGLYDTLHGYKNALHVEDKEFLARVFCQGYKVGNSNEVLLKCRYYNKSITKKNALYVDKIGKYITDIFKNCIKTKHYKYSEKFQETLAITEKEKEAYIKKKLFLQEAREAWNKSAYFSSIVSLAKAMYVSRTVMENIKIHLMLQWYKFRENRGLY